MSTIAASSSPTPYVPVSAPVAVAQPSDVAQANGEGASGGSDPFGPAVVVDLSPAAQQIAERTVTIEDRIKDHQDQWTAWAKKQGKTDEDIRNNLVLIDKNLRESYARADEARKYSNPVQVVQPNLEQTLADTGGPQSLIDAVRDVTSMRNDVGASSAFEATYAKQETRDAIRNSYGEDVLQRVMANGKRSDASARASAPGSASKLSRYGIDGPAFTVTGSGAFKMNSFTLKNISGGYSLAFDADKAEYQVSRQGVDITAAVFAGMAFS